MLDNNGFDLWANTYDKSVKISDKNNTYPFAGYENLINLTIKIIVENKKSTVLDIGIGTGVLSSELYKNGYKITGIDFSEKMIKKCKEKMPSAKLIQYDFSKGLPENLNSEKFDYIVSTYAFHHLNDDEKMILIKQLVEKLNKNGIIIIGDIAFQTRKQLNECKFKNKGEWDDDEYYLVYDEIKNKLENICEVEFMQISICAGIIIMNKNGK